MTTYNHAEAYYLMNYRCKSCGFQEVFWNSRDGVTPFGCECPRCHKPEMFHTEFYNDLCLLNYVPYVGQGVWIDLPESLKRPLSMQAIRMWQNYDVECAAWSDEEVQMHLEAMIKDYHEGEPYLIRWR